MSRPLKQRPANGEFRLDARETALFEDDLDVIVSRVYERKYPDNVGLSLLAAAPFSLPAGARTFTYRMMDGVGTWNVIRGYGQELPRVDLFATEQTGKIRRIGNSFGWNLDELEEWAYTGMSLSSAKANLARDVIEEGLDFIIAFGLSGHDIPGLLNHPNVSATTVATNGGVTTWADKLATNPELIFADIASVENNMGTVTNETETFNTLLLPPSIYRALQQTTVNGYQTFTMLDEIRRRFPTITTIRAWRYLETAGAGGTRRIMFFDNDPNYVYYVLPQPFRVHDTWHSGPLQWVVPCTAKTGGVVLLLPLSAQYIDGV